MHSILHFELLLPVRNKAHRMALQSRELQWNLQILSQPTQLLVESWAVPGGAWRHAHPISRAYLLSGLGEQRLGNQKRKRAREGKKDIRSRGKMVEIGGERIRNSESRE